MEMHPKIFGIRPLLEQSRLTEILKLRSHMCGVVVEPRRADFDIPVHIRRADLPFLEDKDGLECAVSKRRLKIGCWTHLLRSGFCSPLRDRVCVNACNDLCWNQFSACVRSTQMWMYLQEYTEYVQMTFWRKYKLQIQVTLDISGSPIDFQWDSRKYPG